MRFVWVDDIVWEDYAQTVDVVWVGLRVNGYFVCMGLCGKILRSVVGAVPVCPPVSPHKGASIVKIPAHDAVYFWYGNAAARTFGRAHRHRPYGFVWQIACRRLVSFVWDVWKNIAEIGRGGACVPARVALQGCIHR